MRRFCAAELGGSGFSAILAVIEPRASEPSLSREDPVYRPVVCLVSVSFVACWDRSMDRAHHHFYKVPLLPSIWFSLIAEPILAATAAAAARFRETSACVGSVACFRLIVSVLRRPSGLSRGEQVKVLLRSCSLLVDCEILRKRAGGK